MSFLCVMFPLACLLALACWRSGAKCIFNGLNNSFFLQEIFLIKTATMGSSLHGLVKQNIWFVSVTAPSISSSSREYSAQWEKTYYPAHQAGSVFNRVIASVTLHVSSKGAHDTRWGGVRRLCSRVWHFQDIRSGLFHVAIPPKKKWCMTVMVKEDPKKAVYLVCNTLALGHPVSSPLAVFYSVVSSLLPQFLGALNLFLNNCFFGWPWWFPQAHMG